MIRWSNSPRLCSTDPPPLVVVHHVPLSVREHAGGAGIDHQHPRAAEVAEVRPARGRRLPVDLVREAPQALADVALVHGRGEQGLGGQLGGCQVAEVLVHPVGHERAGDAVLPPRLPPRIGDPLPRDVPVVDHVMVVEHHRAGHGGEEPPDVGIAPRLAVEPGVLLEVRDLLPGRLGGVAAGTDELDRLRRHLIRVHLIADQQESVGPRLDAGRKPPGVGPQRVDAEAVSILLGCKRVGRALGRADAAGAEHQPGLVFSAPCVDRARRPRPPGGRPDRLPVEADRVLDHSPLLEPGERHDGVVVAADSERPGSVPEHLDLARAVRLDPHGRLGAADIAQEGAKQERGVHRAIVFAREDGRTRTAGLEACPRPAAVSYVSGS